MRSPHFPRTLAEMTRSGYSNRSAIGAIFRRPSSRTALRAGLCHQESAFSLRPDTRDVFSHVQGPRSRCRICRVLRFASPTESRSDAPSSGTPRSSEPISAQSRWTSRTISPRDGPTPSCRHLSGALRPLVSRIRQNPRICSGSGPGHGKTVSSLNTNSSDL